MTELVTTIEELHALLGEERRAGRSIGLVPTMGALHDGHRSLMTTAAQRCDSVVVSIFVNPYQFGQPADFERYPRQLDADLQRAAGAGAALVFAPEDDELYPDGPTECTVDPGPLGELLEGASRPGHFRAVATIVAKLLTVVGPGFAFFGEKDYQQLVVIRRLVQDLNFPVEIVDCETVRDEDGLALSSRNARLSPAARVAAGVLFRALAAGRDAIGAGERSVETVERTMAGVIADEPLVKLDYAVARGTERLETEARIDGPVRLLIAAQLGDVRLIDNLGAAP